MITSAETRRWADDVEIHDLDEAGLPVSSVVRPCKIATIEARHAERLGCIPPALMNSIGEVLARYIA
jgi:mRNA interferase MazF